tara:strand:- start:2662 stop:2775 length:114 start_codon:yes stop_codon:yes gene_type:complete
MSLYLTSEDQVRELRYLSLAPLIVLNLGDNPMPLDEL